MVIKKRYIGCKEVEGLTGNIIRHLQKDNIKISAVIGIVRGGLTPAVMVSHYYDVPLHILDYSLRDRNDAQEFTEADKFMIQKASVGTVLVIDDINDSGDTLQAVGDMIKDIVIDDKNFIYATLLEKCTSRFDCDYYGEMITDDRTDEWIVFPWEDWWTNKD
jgi:hypoxanthine phosphoribosyltransferase